MLNTTGSQFRGFPHDEYTTLEDAYDRMLATTVSASWRFREADSDWTAAFTAARSALIDAFTQTPSYSLQQTLYGMGSAILDTFAGTHSRALQQTLQAMGTAVLRAYPEVAEIRFAAPNKHHFAVDLAPFGLANDNEVYYAADRPYGLIEGTVLADDAPDAGIAWS